MGHSCVSRNPDNRDFPSFLDSRFRGNDTPPPASFRSRPLPSVGEARLAKGQAGGGGQKEGNRPVLLPPPHTLSTAGREGKIAPYSFG